MANIANQPFADALSRVYPAPDGVKIFTTGADADKMLAFWSLKQPSVSQVLRLGTELFRVVQQSCPHCSQAISARAVKMSKKEREMVAALASMFKQATPVKPTSKAPAKQAKQAPAPVPVPATAEPFEPNSADEMTLEQLEALTQPGA